MRINSTQDVLEIVPGVLMLHKDQPPMIVMATELPNELGDFAGVNLENGVYLESWIGAEFTFFRGSITLEQ